MAKRRKRKKHPILIALLVLLLAGALLVTLVGTRIYMRRTGEKFFPSLGQTVRLGGQFLGNLLSPEDQQVPLNPYTKTDYYRKGNLIHCAASEVSRAGIDVSSHQKEIDWQAVADAGIDFAIIRVGYRGYTDGALFCDTTARQNIEGALAAGLDVGIYFFSQATSEEEALEEAWFVLDSIDGYIIRYPVLFDWEGISADARTDQVTGPEMTQFAQAFCEQIAQAGYTPGIYFNQSYGYNHYNLSALRDYEFWLAEYADAQSFAYEVQLWQYSCEGKVPGVETSVDVNLCYRDYSVKKN